MARRIPVTQLRTGMTLLTEKPNGGFDVDCELARYMPTSSRFPSISFVTKKGANVIWRPVGYVWIR